MAKRTPGNGTHDTTDDGVGPMVQNIAAIAFMLAIAPRLNLTKSMAMTLTLCVVGNGAAIVLISQNLFIVQFSENVL